MSVCMHSLIFLFFGVCTFFSFSTHEQFLDVCSWYSFCGCLFGYALSFHILVMRDVSKCPIPTDNEKIHLDVVGYKICWEPHQKLFRLLYSHIWNVIHRCAYKCHLKSGTAIDFFSVCFWESEYTDIILILGAETTTTTRWLYTTCVYVCVWVSVFCTDFPSHPRVVACCRLLDISQKLHYTH